MSTAVDTTPLDTEMIRTWTAHGGTVLRLRPVAPSDAERMADFVRRLSFGTRYFRFGRGDVVFTSAELAPLCDPDPEAGRHFVVVADKNGVETQIIASARFYILAAGECCEMEILVADSWQGSHVAHRLMTTLAKSAKDCGLKRICARVLPTNARMLGFAQRHGFVLRSGADHGTIRTLCLLLDEIDPLESQGQGDSCRLKEVCRLSAQDCG
jgi:RimJ/RimL family protein N-acetyltransferase